MYAFLPTVTRRFHSLCFSAIRSKAIPICMPFWQPFQGDSTMYDFLPTIPRRSNYVNISADHSKAVPLCMFFFCNLSKAFPLSMLFSQPIRQSYFVCTSVNRSQAVLLTTRSKAVPLCMHLSTVLRQFF